MKNNDEVLLIEDALAMNSKMPLKQIYSCVLCTKNYFFVIPTKSVGMFVIFEAVKNHSYFEGLTIYEGLKKLQNDATDVADLEAKAKDLLENDEKYIFELSQATKLKIFATIYYLSYDKLASQLHW